MLLCSEFFCSPTYLFLFSTACVGRNLLTEYKILSLFIHREGQTQQSNTADVALSETIVKVYIVVSSILSKAQSSKRREDWTRTEEVSKVSCNPESCLLHSSFYFYPIDIGSIAGWCCRKRKELLLFNTPSCL